MAKGYITPKEAQEVLKWLFDGKEQVNCSDCTIDDMIDILSKFKRISNGNTKIVLPQIGDEDELADFIPGESPVQ